MQTMAHQLLVCAECGKPVEQDGDRIARSCSCPDDTEVSARLRATVKAVGLCAAEKG